MGDKKMFFVASIVALLAVNGVVDGSPLCRSWTVTCCCGGPGRVGPVVPIPGPVPFQQYYARAAAPSGPTATLSNDIPNDGAPGTEQPEPIPANEPEETTETTEPTKPEDDGPLPITGPRVTRNTQVVQVAQAAQAVQVAQGKSVSFGYPQPVGNAGTEGYTFYPGFGAYKVHKVGTAWYDALRVCASEGSTLAVISSTAEAELVKTMFRPNEAFPDAVNNMHFWVGVQERGVDGQFYTVFGDRVEQSGYQDWSHYAGGQPNDKGTTDCVSIFIEGAYFDDDCTAKYAFVCKKIL